MGRAQKFSPNDAELHLSVLKDLGHIFGFERLPGNPVRFVIETVPTHREHYDDPEARGQIVLSTREVMAFTEGAYAATRLRPAKDPRDYIASRVVEGERWHPTNRAGDFIR